MKILSRSRFVLAVTLASLAIGCGTLSVSEERRIGAAQQRQIRQSPEIQLLRDGVVVNYVRDLGQKLVAAARPSPFELRFYVIEDESLNAFATFGGAIYVHTGIISAAGDVSELAGVIAHEIGHVTARHIAQNYRRQRNTGVAAQVASIAIAMITGNPYLAQGGQFLAQLSAVAVLNTFTREFEAEADQLAVETLSNAGYDPYGMTRLFRTLQAEYGDSGIRFLSDHPTNAERISAVESKIEELGISGGKSDDRGRLEIIQERIKLIAGTDAATYGDEYDSGESDDDDEEEGE